MMLRLCHTLAIAMLLAGQVPVPVAAAIAPEERVIDSIEAQGYRIIYRERTWLGRIRILAVKGDVLREVVLGPGTGEVLRDMALELPGLAAALAASDSSITIGGVEVPARTLDNHSDGNDKRSVSNPEDPPVVGTPPIVGNPPVVEEPPLLGNSTE
jgi:hypothetical protein